MTDITLAEKIEFMERSIAIREGWATQGIGKKRDLEIAEAVLADLRAQQHIDPILERMRKDRAENADITARHLVEEHIRIFGWVPHPDKIKDAIAAAITETRYAGAEQMRERLKTRIDTRLNDCLCEMKPDYDDSIVGFNEAWDIVRAIFKDEAEAAIRALPVE